MVDALLAALAKEDLLLALKCFRLYHEVARRDITGRLAVFSSSVEVVLIGSRAEGPGSDAPAQRASPEVYEPGGGDPVLNSHGTLPPLGSFLSGADYHARRQGGVRATCIDVNNFCKLALRLEGAKLFLPSAACSST